MAIKHEVKGSLSMFMVVILCVYLWMFEVALGFGSTNAHGWVGDYSP